MDFLKTVKSLVDDPFGLNGAGGAERSPYLKSPSTANIVFGQDQSHFTGNNPYLGFQYYVKFNFDGDVAKNDDLFKKMFNWNQAVAKNLSPLVTSIDLPSVSIATEKLNEYNRWRVSQTKVEYEPIKMTVMDSVNGMGLGLWKAYYNYYFADAEILYSKDHTQIIPDAFTSGSDFGYKLANDVKDIRYMIKSIEIYQLRGTSFNKVEIFNPRITSFSPSTLSYEDSGKLEIDYTIDYEYVRYHPDGMVPESGDMWDFLSTAIVPDVPSPPESATDKFSMFGEEFEVPGEIETIGDLVAEGQDILTDVKDIGQGLAGHYSEASAMFNQVQMDVLGVDEPIIKAPSVRKFSAVVNTIPTGYPDIRRSVRKTKDGSG